MTTHRSLIVVTLVASVALCLLAAAGATPANAATSLSPEEELGKFLFFDPALSINGNQSCAACHGPDTGWTGPDSAINAHGSVYEGSIPGRFGDRKPPASAYAGASPILSYDAEEEVWVGGMFWDGRATGMRLGDPLAEQAQGPFLNPVEQALPDAQAVIDRVLASTYADLFSQVCAGPEDDYDCIGRAIAAYERSAEVNPFTSKYDYYVQKQLKLTPQERQGLALFNGKAKCAACHTLEKNKNAGPAFFTDFTYDNLGLPKNPENPVYDVNPAFVDPGLGGFLMNAGYPEDVYTEEWGKVKVPTLRNVDLRPTPETVKAYGHNGYFKTLEGIVHFYNTRDIKPVCPDATPDDPTDDYTEAEALAAGCWPAPEVMENVNESELGDLGLTPAQEAAIVAFLKTLSDGYNLEGAIAAGLTEPAEEQIFLPILKGQ